MKPSEALAAHRDTLFAIAAVHGASNLRVFGSVAKGVDKEGSDIDMLVGNEDADAARRVLESSGWRYALATSGAWRLTRTATYLWDEGTGVDLHWGVPGAPFATRRLRRLERALWAAARPGGTGLLEPDLGAVLGATGMGVWLDAAINPQGTSEIEKLYAKYAPPTKPGMAFNLDYGLGWEGMMRACAALEKAGTIATDPASREKIAQGLRTVSFNGILTFGTEDANGNCVQNPRILQITSADGAAKVIAENGKKL